MGIFFQKGLVVKIVAMVVKIIKFTKIMILKFFLLKIPENAIIIIAKSKYQKTPCPIWGEPAKVIRTESLNMADKIPKMAKDMGITIKIFCNIFISSLYIINFRTCIKHNNEQKLCRNNIWVSTCPYIPSKLKKGIAPAKTHVDKTQSNRVK